MKDKETKKLLLQFVRNLICENVPLHTICYVFTLINKVLRSWTVSFEKTQKETSTSPQQPHKEDSKGSDELDDVGRT